VAAMEDVLDLYEEPYDPQYPTQEALAAYEQAIRLDPNFALAHNNKGLALEALGKIQEAQQAYERARHLGDSS
jgi:tetratricopeptide (TPR) repeat protein